ncbi:hypothetical protein [Stutzerimonas stutzeri]|jgi:hypothetical protein|uniref:hypothetical protein n=1 Tax=Stutzerimonas TaxID=2901164 RepID=UPI000357BA7D|nr:hypothetical protein [Stutzerimonas stutzeri]EPL59977.1 hypothetical protein B382_23438 [Stutzerimonas stutzeri B1SMN1]MCP3430949.1 hypothetical protein [Stutzerimonas stutzeri]MDH0427292.1 hypothetical protein [Stutzerimonas stutzeri]MDH1540159.1 hypothetical protein [Stutzerimonas stutzeri]MDI9730160.1 hypothetical protein [Stutzerimonas stutzeri]
MLHIDWLIILIGTGFVLLGLGYSFRDRGWGVGMIAAGVLTMFSTVAFKVYITFY